MQASLIEQTLAALSLEQKVSLLAGKSYWRTPSIPEHGVKAIKFSDGPNGVRGESIHASTKAYCFPCGACVGATFNTDFVKRMGVALGKECRMKNVGVLLGPTMNLHRSPLGGRNFEAWSEDPTLTGVFGSNYVKGLQSQGVAACCKHFVGNECEKNRKTSNSVIDEKTLRELYAYAFQITLRDSDPWTFMSSYNKVNNVFMSENKELLQSLLRDEWGFKGAVISDFEGVYSLKAPVTAGLDIEMPGAPLCRGKHLLEAVQRGEIEETQIDVLTSNVLKLAAQVGTEDESKVEGVSKDLETENLLRQIASEGITLLKNKNNMLPIAISKKPKIAVFGSPAIAPVIHGGGSASLTASYIVKPLQALQERYGAENVIHHYGVPIFKKIPSASLSVMRRISDGMPGVDCFWYNRSTFGENLVHHETLETTRTLVIEPRIKALQPEHCSRMELLLTPTTTGTHTFGITSCGATSLYVDGANILSHPGFPDVKVEYIMQPGDFEARVDLAMVAGQPYHIIIDTHSTTAPIPSPVFTMAPQATQVGFFENLNTPLGDDALALASSSDISLVFTANNKEYESESFDRESLFLSAPQNNLIHAVASASKKTFVVNQTGAPIAMPWLDDVDAVLQCWFAGQEVGNALADIICGAIEDTPSFGNFPTDENLQIHYAEGLQMGYRARNGPKPLFPFGFGLSYTTFAFSDLTLTSHGGPCDVDVCVTVHNTGAVAGKEVVQVYVDGVLKAFQKTGNLGRGEAQNVVLKLDKYAFSGWDVEGKAWVAKEGGYEISVRRDAETVVLEERYTLEERVVWRGL